MPIVAKLIERYTLLLRNNDRKFRPLMNKLINEMQPANARRSIIFDRGFEFSSWRELHKGMGTKSWFCDPQAPWQNGLIKNTNRLLRQYCSDKTDLAVHSPGDLDLVATRLNTRPPKTLGLQTPADRMHEMVR